MGWTGILCAIAIVLAASAPAGALTSGHFDVEFKGCSDPGNCGLRPLLDAAYDDVNGLFGTCPGHIEVEFISDHDMDRVGKQVDSFNGWNKEFSIVILRNSSIHNSSLPVLVRHELTHLAINEILCKKDPAGFHWMEEGICTLVSKEPLDDADVSNYIVKHGFLDTGQIYDAIKSEDCAASKNGYMQSYGLVKYMQKRYGFSLVKELLECPDESLDDAFLKYTGESFASFYDEWKGQVKPSMAIKQA